MPAKNRLQRFIEVHKQSVEFATGEAREIHEAFLELALILASELDKKKDKKKTELEKALDGQSLTRKQILFVKNPKCGICGRVFKNINEATIDHIKPVSKGGKGELRNLQLACPECNVRKGNQYNQDDPNRLEYLPTKRNIRFMLEESNIIEGVPGKEAVDEAYQAWVWLMQQDEITPTAIKHCHAMLMRNRDLEKKYKGAWRDVPVWIGGQIKSQSPALIQSLIEDWCNDIKKHEDLEVIKLDHIKFEGIHPFADGNGRMGRILMNWQLVKHNKPLCVILDKEKQEYYKWFQK